MSAGTIQLSSLPSTLREQAAPHKARNLPSPGSGALPAAPSPSRRVRGARGRAEAPHGARRRHDSGARSRRQVSLGAEAAPGAAGGEAGSWEGRKEGREPVGLAGGARRWAALHSLRDRVNSMCCCEHCTSMVCHARSPQLLGEGERFRLVPPPSRHPVTGHMGMDQNCRRRGSD